jgi:mannosidase alpha-like ER degradation enhancer 2
MAVRMAVRIVMRQGAERSYRGVDYVGCVGRGRWLLVGLFLVACLAAAGCAVQRQAPASVPVARAGAGPLSDPASAALVREEARFAWQSYERYAWGHDELMPVSKGAHDWHAEPLLVTPVDALDTLLLLGLDEEAAKARALIDERLSFDRDVEVKVFEITIRVLGGLLSGYQMTGDARLLHLADDLGARLLPAFGSPTGMPYMYVNLRTGRTRGNVSNPAEIGTLLLEFGTLSRLTGKPVYYDKAKAALVKLFDRRSVQLGLVGDTIAVDTGEWTGRTCHIGGGIDSYYEYLLKGSRLFGDVRCGSMWHESIVALNKYVADDTPAGLWYGQADMNSGKRTGTEFGALEAFFPAVLALGGDLQRAERLQASSYAMWNLHGIEPDGLDYHTMTVTAPAYPLRPEIIESAYYLHHYTHDPRYLEEGRTFLAALRQRCRTEGGYTVLTDVRTGAQGDLMPSYFLAETLKYLYLLFAPDSALDFDHVTFNTEGHPLRAVNAGR